MAGLSLRHSDNPSCKPGVFDTSMRNQAQLVGKASPRADPAPRPDASRVSADMEGIFGGARPEGAGEAPRGPDGIVPIIPYRARPRRKQSWKTPVWAAGVVLLILSGAAWLALSSQRSGPGPTGGAAIAEAVAPIRPTRTRAPAAGTGPVAQSATPDAAAKPAGTEADAGAPPAATAPTPRRPAARVSRSQAVASCNGLSRLERSRCMRPQIIDADMELRRVYARATRAGVSPRMLNSYNRRWSRLLEKSTSDPDEVMRKLRDMARKLEAERLAQAGDRL